MAHFENSEDDQLSQMQIEEQDRIDGIIHTMICDLLGHSEIEWDIEMIGQIRDSTIDALKLRGFNIEYPFIDTK